MQTFKNIIMKPISNGPLPDPTKLRSIVMAIHEVMHDFQD